MELRFPDVLGVERVYGDDKCAHMDESDSSDSSHKRYQQVAIISQTLLEVKVRYGRTSVIKQNGRFLERQKGVDGKPQNLQRLDQY